MALARRNRREYEWPVEKLRTWILQGKTHQWIGDRLEVNPKLVSKACKRHSIPCHRRGPRSGAGHPEWKGGRIFDRHGYALVYRPGHPMARGPSRKYVPEHRLVMSEHLGRVLTRSEVVHHKNRNPRDNRLSNLRLFSSNGEHLRHELTGRCPKWSRAGKERIRLAGIRWRASHAASKRGETLTR